MSDLSYNEIDNNFSDNDYDDESSDNYSFDYSDDFEEEIDDNYSVIQDNKSIQNNDYNTELYDSQVDQNINKDNIILMLEDEQPEDIIINESMKKFINSLFKKSEKKSKEFSDLFDNELLREFNKKKKLDEKHAKFNIDKYNLLIRENKFNKKSDPYGWVFDKYEEPINIHVSEELQITKTKEEIFDIIMNELVNQKQKIQLTVKSVPTQIYKILNINIDKYIIQNKK